MNFTDLQLSEPILRALEKKQYTEPTPIQEQAIPVVLSGNDLLGIAQTGTGKTAAFAIPIIQMLNEKYGSQPKKKVFGNKSCKVNFCKALILTPTRELAIQIDENVKAYSEYTKITSTVIYGGVKQYAQIRAMKSGADILIATPGRLLDLINQGFISLHDVEHFVLDEADRMLDMGFIHDIKKIIELVPQERQTLFFSATMPDSICSLSSSMLNNPERVEVTPESSVIENIEQKFIYMDRGEKMDVLVSLIQKDDVNSTLVFSRTKRGADRIAQKLNKTGIHCDAIHGDKAQNARQRALTNFKKGKTNVIIATDIAARGIDINDLGRVINYDLPDVAETYIHRIGRTGRAGKEGSAMTFCTSDEKKMVREIMKITSSNYTEELTEKAAARKESNERRTSEGRKSAGASRSGSSKNSSRRSSSHSSKSGSSRNSSKSSSSRNSRSASSKGGNRGGKSYGRAKGKGGRKSGSTKSYKSYSRAV